MSRLGKRVLSSAVNAGDLLTLATRELTIRQHESAITTQRTALMNQAATLATHTPIINKLNTNVGASGDLSSVEQAIALSDKYIYCINKLNFTLGCISQNAGSITSRSHYATVVRPVFESHYTDTSVASDGYVVIADAIARNTVQSTIHFFEPDETWDNVQQNTWSTYRENFEPIGYDIFTNLQSRNPTQSQFYVLIPYNWPTGVKIAFFLFIRDVTDPNHWIKIVSGFNLTQVMPAYSEVRYLPPSYLLYLQHIQDAFNGFSATQSNTTNVVGSYYSYLQYMQQVNNKFIGVQSTNIPTAQSDGTIYQYGPIAKFNTLKVVSSTEYPSWAGKLISECYIPGSNINMPNIISQINTELNRNYTGMRNGEIVMVHYAVGDEYYTGVIKMLQDSSYNLFYKITQININNIISSAVSLNGDVSVKGNLNVSRYNNEPIITTDNVRRTTTFHDKVGINQHAYEVDAILDIDNLTKQDIVDLFTNSTSGAVNSSDIMNIIRANPIATSATAISALFGSGYPLFDYKDQCSVFTSKLDFIIDPSNISPVHDFDITKWSTGTFTRIQQLVKEVKQMSSEYTAANDSSFMFTFVELFSDANLSWFFTTIKAIRQDASGNDILIFVLTKIDVTSKMIDPSYTGILTSVVDYISRLNRNVNYNVLLFKNTSVPSSLYNSDGSFDIDKYNQEKQNNPYFSRGFDLLPESYMFIYEKDTNRFKYHGNFTEWSGVLGYHCWTNSLNAGYVLEEITRQLSINYNDVSNGNFCVKYIWTALQKLSFVHKTMIGGKEYIIGSGVGIKSILNRSLKVRGEGNFTGDFIVNDAYDNVIFKVDNVNRTISNAYNVGVGTTTPLAMLDVKDTSVQNVIDEVNVRINQLKRMNPILDTMRSSGFNETTHAYNLTEDTTYAQYTVVYKIDTDTLSGEHVTVVHHQLHTTWKNKTLATILADDSEIANRSLIQSMIKFLQATLDSEMIFDGNYFIRIFNHIVYGATNVGHAIVQRTDGNTYIYTHNTSLFNYDVRHTLSRSVAKLFETRECISKATANLWRNVKCISSVINLQEGRNVLNSLIQRNSDIRKSIYKVVFDVTDSVNPANIYVTDMSFTDMSFNITVLSANGPALSTTSNDIIQKFIRMVNATMKAYGDNTKANGGFKTGDLLSVAYQDNINDYLAVSRCYDVSGNIVTLIVPEFRLQDALIPSLNVVGDAKVVGDLMISDASTNFVSIDPVQKFVGINTDDRMINYPDRKYTTTTNADDPLIGKYDAKHHVHVKGKTYPVMVSERIQEVDASANTPNPQYFGTCSGFTVKRTSELYDFTQIVNYATTQNTNEALDAVTKVKYGPDVSFEVCDKTNRTVELGNVQMTIDQTETKHGTTYLKGGFGVQVIDPPATPTDLSKNRNIMYVDNSGTLFINKIKLGGKELSVEGDVLKWGGNKINLGGKELSVEGDALKWDGKTVRVDP